MILFVLVAMPYINWYMYYPSCRATKKKKRRRRKRRKEEEEKKKKEKKEEEEEEKKKKKEEKKKNLVACERMKNIPLHHTRYNIYSIYCMKD